MSLRGVQRLRSSVLNALLRRAQHAHYPTLIFRAPIAGLTEQNRTVQ
jgi:hypothetical protein